MFKIHAWILSKLITWCPFCKLPFLRFLFACCLFALCLFAYCLFACWLFAWYLYDSGFFSISSFYRGLFFSNFYSAYFRFDLTLFNLSYWILSLIYPHIYCWSSKTMKRRSCWCTNFLRSKRSRVCLLWIGKRAKKMWCCPSFNFPQ